jgi:hypothetical protein
MVVDHNATGDRYSISRRRHSHVVSIHPPYHMVHAVSSSSIIQLRVSSEFDAESTFKIQCIMPCVTANVDNMPRRVAVLTSAVAASVVVDADDDDDCILAASTLKRPGAIVGSDDDYPIQIELGARSARSPCGRHGQKS